MPIARIALAALVTLLAFSAPALADEPDNRPPSMVLHSPVVADNSICLHATEVNFNHGGKTVLRLKGNQHILLMAFNLQWPIIGEHLAEARIYLHAAGELKLRRFGLAMLRGSWTEGASRGPAARGESTFLSRAHGTSGWTGPGSTFLEALGRFHYTDIHDHGDGLFSVPLPASLLREIGGRRSFSLAITDEQGQTMWNNDFYSREDVARAPYMAAKFGPALPDRTPAADVPDLAADEGKNAEDASEDSPRRQLIQALADRILAAGPAGAASTNATPRQDGHARQDDDPGFQFRITTPYDNVHPLTGQSRPESAADNAGRLWDGSSVTLHAARNWFSAFQLIVPTSRRGPRPIGWEDFVDAGGRPAPGLRGQLLWVWYLRGADEADPQWHGGPLIGSLGHLARMDLPEQRFQAVYAEIYVPRNLPPGVYRSALLIVNPGAAHSQGDIRIPITLTAHPATLSDELGYKLSLNTYGSPGGMHGAKVGTRQFLRDEIDFHRLAHEHRATLAVVPYSQAGQVAPGMAPQIDLDKHGRVEANWDDWDARWQPYFSGRAFDGLPRSGQPIDHFYLPLHENWPLPLDEHYKWAGPWETHWQREGPIAEGLSRRYQTAWASAARAFVEHLDQPQWRRTQFHVYLNNKWSFKREGGPGSSYWDLDEPAFLNDHLALAHFARAFHRAADGHAPHVVFRADISRPQFERGLLQQMDDLRVCNAWRDWPAQSLTRQQLPARPLTVWSYGESDPPGSPLVNQWTWCMEAYAAGCDGMAPWQSLGRQDSWVTPRATSLIYPARPWMAQKPVAGLRLKALRDAQQDIELLRLLTGESGQSTSLNWGTDRARLLMALCGAPPVTRRKVEGAPLVTADLSDFTPDQVLSLRNNLLHGLK